MSQQLTFTYIVPPTLNNIYASNFHDKRNKVIVHYVYDNGQYSRRPTQSGTVPLFMEQFQFLWNSVPKMWNSSTKSGTGAESGSLFHKLRENSTICRTAPPKVEQVVNSDESHK